MHIDTELRYRILLAERPLYLPSGGLQFFTPTNWGCVRLYDVEFRNPIEKVVDEALALLYRSHNSLLLLCIVNRVTMIEFWASPKQRKVVQIDSIYSVGSRESS